MTGFSDPIVGGVGTLIRQYIKSPNYVAGVSGWSINQDGSSEFNNLSIRGTIELQPAVIGQTPHSIWWNDPFAIHGQIVMDGNNGLWIVAGRSNIAGAKYGTVLVGTDRGPGCTFVQIAAIGVSADIFSTFVTAGEVAIIDNNGAGHGQIFLGNAGSNEQISVQGSEFDVNVPTTFFTSANRVVLQTGVTEELQSGAALKIDPGATLQQGNGAAGQYYHEEINTGSSSYAAGSVLPVLAAGLAQTTIHSDYGAGGQFSSGVGGALTFTAPEDGAYLINIGCGGIGTTLGAATRFELNIVGGRGNDCASFNGVVYTDDVLWLAKNTTVTFQFFQNSGAARNAPFTVRAHRLV